MTVTSIHSASTAPLLCLVAIVATALAGRSAWSSEEVPNSRTTELRSQASEPYRLAVVLRFANHAALTPLLRQSVMRQARDQLRNVFGELAEVRVTTEHPLVDRLAGGDLENLSLLPADFDSDACFAAGDEQLFLISVDFRDDAYQLAWRQIDRDVERIGTTQTMTTADRQWLGKALCLAVRDDFSPVGIVKPASGAGAKHRNVEIEVRGSQTRGGPRLASWLTPGTVLAPYWVVRERDGSLGRVPLAYTVLRIESMRGSYWARAESNLPDPWQRGTRVVGFQAIRLPTRSGRLRLRLVDLKGTIPVQAATVYAGDQGFAKLGDADLLGAPDPAGYVSSARTFDQVAYVRIVQGAGSAIDVPVPITAAECELVCKVPVDRGAGDKSDLERRIGYLVDDVRALQALVVERVHQINELNGAKRYEDALASAREALDLMHKHVPALRRACGAVDERTTALSLAADPRRAWLAAQFDDIDRQQASLDKLSGNLDSTIRRNDAQSRANVLIELGNQALGQGNADEAIDKYALALGEQPDQPGLAARLAALKRTWAVHGPEHEAARRFAYQTWPITELAQIEARLPDAEKAEERFEQVGDGYSAIKLMKTNEQLMADLDRLVGELSQRDGAEDRKEHEKYVGVLERLAKLQARVAKFCQSTPLDLAPTTDAANSDGPAGGGQPAAQPAPKKAAAPPTPSKPASAHPPDPRGGQPKQKPAVTPPAAADDEEEPPLNP